LESVTITAVVGDAVKIHLEAPDGEVLVYESLEQGTEYFISYLQVNARPNNSYKS